MGKIIGLISNPEKQETVKSASELLKRYQHSTDVHFLLDQYLSDALDLKDRVATDDQMGEKADLIVVLGGDGTFLSAVKRIQREKMPFLGINHGGLGFLAEFTVDSFKHVVNALIDGTLLLEKRLMLDIRLTTASSNETPKNHCYEALNDCVITKGALSRVLHFKVFVDDQFLNAYSADGFIISTPTGSTAYSLSCGGPLVAPDTEVLILTPISPHTLSNRPLIVGSNKKIKVVLEKGIAEVGLTIDGQIGHALNVSDYIEVTRSDRNIFLVESGLDYFEILREKLGWRGTSHYRTKLESQ
ncbi:MAG: NAD(+)/NADH kinase [Chlamydiota bacterium]|nr:NAD(+)/NADH kinase [Chlamydiota bacterium]